VAKSLFLLIVLGGAGFSWMCTPGQEKEPVSSSSSLLVRNQGQRSVNVTRLYDDTCGKCHGINGEGGGGGTKSVLTRDKYDQKWDKPFFDAIKKGVPEMGMDPYGETLSDAEIWALVVHMRELQSKYLRNTEGGPKATEGVYTSKHYKYKIETVIEDRQGLAVPWAIDWLPDGKMLITNRPGFMYVAEKGKLGARIEGLPESRELGQGGLMDVAVHPDYKKNGWVYLSFTDPKKDNSRAGMTKIVRGKLKFSGEKVEWTNQQTIFEAEQEFYTGAGVHFGSKIVFDGKGHVFFNVGERGANMLAQELSNPFGKIYRLNDDGTVPSDNPFLKEAVGGKKHVAAIWTFGHRNPQGLAIGLDGNLWDTEHGPRGGDEFNKIVKGGNYGWPLAVWSINYNDSPFRTPWATDGKTIVQPVFRWLPSIGASGLDVAKGPAFPNWKGDLFAGGLSGANLDRFRTKNGELVEHEEIIWGMGRVRDVACGPDGYIYVALNQPDKIIRVVPAP
jgi:aldose sugar dehydrogenase